MTQPASLLSMIFTHIASAVFACGTDGANSRKRTGNSLGVSGHRSGITGQRRGNADGSAGAETEQHSPSLARQTFSSGGYKALMKIICLRSGEQPGRLGVSVTALKCVLIQYESLFILLFSRLLFYVQENSAIILLLQNHPSIFIFFAAYDYSKPVSKLKNNSLSSRNQFLRSP